MAEKKLKSHDLYFGDGRRKNVILFRGAFRTQSNIYDGVFFAKIFKG